jgi:uncharacterized protein (DUF2267 family)
MMMAHDSTPDRPELNASSVEVLRSAFRDYLADGDSARLQAALRVIAGQAREKQMRAEHLLVQLKDIWFELPEISRAPEGEEQNRLLQRVVTLSIREYYSY